MLAMALTKDDLQAIDGLLKPIRDEQKRQGDIQVQQGEDKRIIKAGPWANSFLRK